MAGYGHGVVQEASLCTENSNPNVLVMKSADSGAGTGTKRNSGTGTKRNSTKIEVKSNHIGARVRKTPLDTP
jgi:hypothetical protein